MRSKSNFRKNIEVFFNLVGKILSEKSSEIANGRSDIQNPLHFYPANIYLFKVNNGNTRRRCEI